MTKPKLRMRMVPSAGWVICEDDDPTWTHVLDRHGVAWARGEEMPVEVLMAGRCVRPKLHGEQLELLVE